MTDQYDPNSCNALEKPFYRPVEAAIRWCGLIEHESQILESVGSALVPPSTMFPQWPCLHANALKIVDAMREKDIPTCRDGKRVGPEEQVSEARRTVRHEDLRAWMEKRYPSQRPKFLFDEVERSLHPGITVHDYHTLKATLEATRHKLDDTERALQQAEADLDAARRERDALTTRAKDLGTTERRTLLWILYAMAKGEPYFYDENAPRSEAAATIASACAAAKNPVTAETVLKYLRQAADASKQ